MLVYGLTEYSGNYSKTLGSFWQYCRDKLDGNITDSNSFKFKSRFLNNYDGTRTVIVEIALPLKYFSNCWKTHEIPLTNCEISLVLMWLANLVIYEANTASIFAVIDTKLYVLVVNLSTQDNTKLLQKLNSRFKRTTN